MAVEKNLKQSNTSKLIGFREKSNLTQEELAEKSGISVRTIQRIEAGTAPKGHTLKALAKALSIAENDLLLQDETPVAEINKNINYTWLKLINLSSLPITFLPPANILLPLFIIYVSKQNNALSKQLLSIQILWTILSVIIFMVTAIIKSWIGWSNKFNLIVMILLILTNVWIILRNAAEIAENKRLYIRLNFSII